MKRSLSIFAFLVASSVLAVSCSGKNGIARRKGTYTVAYSHSGVKSKRNDAVLAHFKSVFTKENGYKLIVSDCGTDAGLQFSDIEKMKSLAADVLVVSPCASFGYDEILEFYANSRKPIIFSDNVPTLNSDKGVLSEIALDYDKESRQVISTICEVVRKSEIKKENLDFCFLTESADVLSNTRRYRSLMEAAKREKNFRFAGRKNIDGGKKDIEEFFSSAPDIDVVFAFSESAAWDATEILRKQGRIPGRDIFLVCYNVSKDILPHIRAGYISCAVVTPIEYAETIEHVISKMAEDGTVLRKMTMESKIYTSGEGDRFKKETGF